MTSERIRVGLYSLAIGAMTTLVGTWLYQFSSQSATSMLRIDVFDVGQGSAALLTTPSGKEVLIDTGKTKQVLREMGRVRPLFDRDIDYVLITHPDTDHNGALPDVLERYRIGTILTTAKQSDAAAYKSALSESVTRTVPTKFLQAGDTIELDEGVRIDILYPFTRDVSKIDANDSSLVLMISYGQSNVLITGDASQEVERELIQKYGQSLRSEILFVGHHGSKSSSDKAFIAMVDADYSVISSGADNKYGHPHQTVLDTLGESNTEVLRTDREGSFSLELSTSSVRVIR